MSSQCSGDARHYEVGAIRICQQAESSEALNHNYNAKRPEYTQKSKCKANNETVKQKQERMYSEFF